MKEPWQALSIGPQERSDEDTEIDKSGEQSCEHKEKRSLSAFETHSKKRGPSGLRSFATNGQKRQKSEKKPNF